MHSIAVVLCLLVATANYLLSASSTCQFSVSCPCGKTGVNYTLCKGNFSSSDDICHQLSRCEECREGVDECVRCPSGFAGPTCSKNLDLMYCENPGPLSNGKVVIQPVLNDETMQKASVEDLELPERTRLNYFCEEGYNLKGFSFIVCEATGFWNHLPPICVEECGLSSMFYTRRMFSETTIPGEWPWTVAVAIQTKSGLQIICGGVLINERTVLTAAHCVHSQETIELYIGKYWRLIQEDDRKVQRRTNIVLKIHDRYNSTTFESDIALVQFTPSVAYDDHIRPICLPTPGTTAKSIQRGRLGYVTGFALTKKQQLSDTIMMARIPVIPISDCIAAFGRRGIVLPNTRHVFCSVFDTTSICSMLGGSPMVFANDRQRGATLEGIVSYGDRRNCGSDVVLTKVLTYMPWILRNMS